MIQEATADTHNLDEALEIVEWLSKNIFTKHRYPNWVKATRRIKRINSEKGIITVRIHNRDRWLDYALHVQASMNLTPNTSEYSIWVVAKLGKTHDLFLSRSKFATLRTEFTTSSKDFAYFFNREFRETLLYWQALAQMKWTNLSLFQLLRYNVSRLLRAVGMSK